MIRDEVAFRQKYDMEDANSVCTFYTDIDMVTKLPNGKLVIHEFKKDILPQHNPEEIIQTEQWKTIQKLAGTDNYAIYSTHNEDVSNKDIPFKALKVRHVELNGQALDFPAGIFLYDYLNKLGARNAYFIIVTYPETKIKEMALKFPTQDQKWSIPVKQVCSGQCIFKTEEECLEYIKKRYEKDFNQKNKYSIYYNISEGNRNLIHEYTYPEIIGL